MMMRICGLQPEGSRTDLGLRPKVDPD